MQTVTKVKLVFFVILAGGVCLITYFISLAQEPTDPKNLYQSITTPIERKHIDVTSQTVKKVNGEYRYFFDIRNNDTQDFSGSVTIKLYNASGEKNGEDTFTTTTPFAPKQGRSEYIELHTGTPQVAGDYGLVKYQYEVKEAGQIVKTGEGDIRNRIVE